MDKTLNDAIFAQQYVVLTENEWATLHNDHAKALYNKRKETARELATTIMSVLWEEEKNESIKIKDVHAVIQDILSERYGVEEENESGND